MDMDFCERFRWKTVFKFIFIFILMSFFSHIYSFSKYGTSKNYSCVDVGGVIIRSLLTDSMHSGRTRFQNVLPTTGENSVRAAMNNFGDENIAENDPKLLSFIRSLMLPPSKQEQAFTEIYYKTPQANAVMDILKNKRNGVFIECGAYDGETSSNTAFLEYEMGWSGLLVEMSPLNYLQLVGKNRNAYSINACLSTTKNVYEANITQFGQLTRLDLGQGPKILKAPPSQHVVLERPSFTVPCFPLSSLLYAVDMLKVDYFSLDIEGLEREVLQSIPWSKLDIKVLSVEYRHGKHIPAAMKALMKNRGYDLYADIDHSDPRRLSYTKDFIFVKKGV